jgi:hypothetical protein
MKSLQAVRLKPNPAGKDRTRRGGAATAQLGGEWVDIQNTRSAPVDLSGVTLYHIAYSGAQDAGTWEAVMNFKGTLGVGEVVRVHAGQGPVTALHDVDQQGSNYHLFTGRDQYVWNNDRGDCAALFQAGQSNPFDKACYDPNPPEGVILMRVANRLVYSSGIYSGATVRR